MSIFSRIRDFFTGGSKKPKTTTRRLSRANTVSYYGGGGSSGGYRAYSEARRKELQRKKERQEQENTTKKLAAITDKVSGDVVNTAKNPKVLKAIEKRAKSTPPKPKAKVSDSPYATKSGGNSEFYSRNTKPKTAKPITDPYKGKVTADSAKSRLYAERRDNYGNKAITKKDIKNAFDYATPLTTSHILTHALTPEYAEEQYKKHPRLTSFARGVNSGVTFGVSDLVPAALSAKNERHRKAEDTYQKYKSTPAEIGGMLAGSVPSFGGIAEPARNLLGRGVTKVAPNLAANATERMAAKLAGKKYIQSMASKAATRAAERGLVEGATKEVTDAFAKGIARRIITGVERDVAINMTGGALMDATYAAKEAEDSKDFLKKFGQNQLLSYTLGGIMTVAPELRVGRALPVKAANKIRHGITGKGYGTTLRPDLADMARGIGNIGADDVAKGIVNNYKVGLNKRRVTDVSLPTPRNAGEAAEGTAQRYKVGLGRRRTTDVSVPRAQTVDEAARIEPPSYGYHAGDLGKAEWFGNQAGSNRGTGHFGTGTYFVGDESIISKSGSTYSSRPRHKIDFGKYKLYKPKNEAMGVRVHQNLKALNSNSLDLDGFFKRLDVNMQNASKLYRELDDALFSGNREEVDRIANRVFSKSDFEAIEDAAKERLETWHRYNVEDATFERAYRAEMEERLERELAETMEYGGKYDQFIFEMANDLRVSEKKIREALRKTKAVVDGYDTAGTTFLREDSPSTIFMKELGFEGVDVRGIKGLDNTEYGSVIYDLRPEDAPKPKIESEKPKTELPKPKKRTKNRIEISNKLTQLTKKNRDEYYSIIKEIEDEYGSINPDYGKLTQEQREAINAKKKRMIYLDLQKESLARERRKLPAPPPKEPEPDIATEIRELTDEKIALQNNIEAKYGKTAPSDINMTEPEKAVYEAQKQQLDDVSSRLEEKRESLRPNTVAEEADTATAKVEPPNAEAKADARAEAEAKAEPPKGKAGTKAESKTPPPKPEGEAERIGNRKFDNRFEEYNEEVRRASNNEYGARKGVKTVSKMVSDQEQKRMFDKMARELGDIQKDNINLGDTELKYKVLTKKGRSELVTERFAVVADDPAKAYSKLIDKLDPDELVSLRDLADCMSLKKLYNDLGIPMPKDMEQTISDVILKQKTEQGQGLRAGHLLLEEHSPEFRAECIRRDFDTFRDYVCGVDNWEDIKRSMDARYGAGYFERRFKELIDVAGTDIGEVEYKKMYRALQRDIFRNTKPSFWNVVNFYRHSFMLMGVNTGANNIIGNSAQAVMHSLADKFDIASEIALEKIYGKENIRRTTTILTSPDEQKLAWSLTTGEVGSRLKRSYEGFANPEYAKAIDDITGADVPEIMSDAKWGIDAEIGADWVADSTRGKIRKGFAKVGGTLNKGVGLMLNEPDNWFVEHHYRTSLLKYLKANGIDTAEKILENPALVRDAREHATAVAKQNTYKQANRIVKTLERWRAQGYRKGTGAAGIGKKVLTLTLDARVPYLKVPVNMTINGLQYSPMGIMKYGVDGISALRRGDIEALQLATRGMSKGLSGTGIAILGFLLACDEQMDDDSIGFIAHADEDLKEYGYRDNSFKWGNKHYNMANMGMGAMQFMMGAEFAERLNERGGAPASFLDNVDLVTSAFSSVFDTVEDMSLVENAVDIIDELGNGGDYEKGLASRIGNVALQTGFKYAGQFIPAPARAYARGATEGDLDTGVKKGEGTTPTGRNIQRGVNNLISNIPVVNEKVLPHKVDTHGNLVNARPTKEAKTGAVVRNYVDPFKRRVINIPEADKVELRAKDENGNGYKPKAFDQNRTYQASIGKGQFKETIDLTGKEREQAARSVKKSGHEMGESVVYAKRGWFGDSHGERAQQILREIPEDEEKAREYLYNTPEFKALNDEERREFMDTLYVGDTGHRNTRGRERVSNHAVYVDIHGGDEGDFKFLNDLNKSKQEKYAEYDLEAAGVTKGEYADAVEAMEWASHKYKDGNNVDTITSKGAMVEGILSLGLEREKNIAIYNAMRGKRKWKDWDGVSGASYGGYRRGRRGWRRYHRRGGGSSKVGVNKSAPKVTGLKAGVALTPKSSATSKRATSAQYTPKLARVQAKIDLPTPKASKERRT